MTVCPDPCGNMRGADKIDSCISAFRSAGGKLNNIIMRSVSISKF